VVAAPNVVTLFGLTMLVGLVATPFSIHEALIEAVEVENNSNVFRMRLILWCRTNILGYISISNLTMKGNTTSPDC
jgi:hypothetical protein